MKALFWTAVMTAALGGCAFGVVSMVFSSNAALADETAAASEKRVAELTASWRGAAPAAAAFVVFDDFDTSGPRRIAGGAAAKALWRSFTKRLGVVEEPALAPLKPMVADYRAPVIMRASDRDRQIAAMALAMRAVADAGGRVHVVTRGAPAARAAGEALARGGVRAKRFVALGARSLDFPEGAPAADDFVAAFIEGSPVLRAERLVDGAWIETPADFSADPLETAVDLADPKPPLVKGRWKGEAGDDADPQAAYAVFELFLEQDGAKLKGRRERANPSPKKGKPAVLVDPVAGRADPDGSVRIAVNAAAGDGIGVKYEGRVSTDSLRIEGRWSSAESGGPLRLTLAANLRTIVVVPRAELERNMRRGEEPEPAEAAAPAGPAKPAGPDLRGSWTGTMKGAKTAPASMRLTGYKTPHTATGTFTLSGAELGVEVDRLADGGLELRFPSEGGSFGCAGKAREAKSLTAECGMGGEPFKLELTRRR